MYYVSICMYFGKYLQVFLSRYVEIDQVVFDKNTYAILTNRFTDGVERTSRAPDAPVPEKLSDTAAGRSRSAARRATSPLRRAECATPRAAALPPAWSRGFPWALRGTAS
jgi:hypothetical protein